ncbi:hypothetical protein [Endozoicomonas sp. 4G]|uniref:hypothetical protein n=1 Tax=Endozoicomonas sp. 4G TaxID=2872754 RepID=UPI00207918B3|nr:hypothetical protein [Endozoicomonas sp. 4G]
MKFKYAACIILLLSYTHLHAIDVEKRIIGTWLIKDNVPHNTYITYHPPHHYTGRIEFTVPDYGDFCSNDIVYGRYDVVLEFPGQEKGVAASGIWFFLRDNKDKIILELNHNGVDVDNFSLPPVITKPFNGLSMTRIVEAKPKEFIFEEYIPINKAFEQSRAIKTRLQSLEQIKEMPIIPPPNHDEL